MPSIWTSLNSLPNNKVLDLSKLKGFADDKINVTQKVKFILGRVKKHYGGKKNAVKQYFPFNFFYAFQD